MAKVEKMTMPLLTSPGLSVVACALLVPIMALLYWMFWRDLRLLLVDYVPLACTAVLITLLVWLLEGASALLPALSAGAIIGLVAMGFHRLMPKGMGSGDPWLFGVLGLAAGQDYFVLTLMLTSGIACVVSMSWSLARGRGLFGSIFPAGTAVIPAIGAGVTFRMVDASGLLPIRLEEFYSVDDPVVAIPVLALGVFALVCVVLSRRFPGSRLLKWITGNRL